MKLKLITFGTQMPTWVQTGYQEYSKRLQSTCPIELIELPLIKRNKNSDLNRILREESKQMLAVIKPDDHVIALAIQGKSYSTENLASELQQWQLLGRNVCLLVGGPEGLSEECLARANGKWSLSALTLPHPLVRVILVEQIYRAMTILAGHPYHR